MRFSTWSQTLPTCVLPRWWTSSCLSLFWLVGDLSKSPDLKFFFGFPSQRNLNRRRVTTLQEEKIRGNWLVVKADRSLINDVWFGKNKVLRHVVETWVKSMKHSKNSFRINNTVQKVYQVNLLLFSLVNFQNKSSFAKKTKSQIYLWNNVHIIIPWRH